MFSRFIFKAWRGSSEECQQFSPVLFLGGFIIIEAVVDCDFVVSNTVFI